MRTASTILPQQTSLLFTDEWTSSPADSPASLSALPDIERERTMTATSGRRCLERFEKLPQATSWAKTLTAFLLGQTEWYSKPCALTWRMKATKFKRIAFQLAPKTHPTDGTGGGLLHTPTSVQIEPTEERKVKRMAFRQSIGRKSYAPGNLQEQISMMMLPTPTISGNHNRAGLSEKSGDGLATRLAMLPTPKVQNANSPGIHGQGGQDLQTILHMLPITATRDYKGTNSDEHLSKDRGHHDQLPNALKMNTGLKLQPAFVLWMMGYPEDWTLLPFLQSPNTPPENGEKKASKPPETPSFHK